MLRRVGIKLWYIMTNDGIVRRNIGSALDRSLWQHSFSVTPIQLQRLGRRDGKPREHQAQILVPVVSSFEDAHFLAWTRSTKFGS
jgi:hypothetical protein